MLNKHEVDILLDEIYRGVYNTHNLPPSYYIKTAKLLEDELNKGFGETATENQKKLYRNLRNNLYYFSAAKTYHLVNAVSALKGEDRKTFLAKSKDIVDKFSGEYLAVEKKATFQSTNTAKKWAKYDNRKTVPYLEYITMKDNRVRPAHVYLDGIIRRLDDSFWTTFYPPNGWLCRCKTKSTSKGENTDLRPFDMETALYDVPPLFRNNSGMSGQVFTKEHPYFKVNKDDKDLAKNNFNLPLPHQPK